MRAQRERRYRLASAVLAALLIATLAPATAAAAPPSDDTGRWIVTLQPGVKAADRADAIAKAAGGRSGAVYGNVLNGFVFEGSDRAAAALRRNPNVRTVVADRPVAIAAETVPVGLRRLDVIHPTDPDAHDAGFTGAGARVAILDTGIDLTHPDLVGNLDAGLGINCYNGGDPQDGHGHGTHVAGTVAAVGGNGIGVVGVAPSARLVAVKVLSDSGTGEWSHVICGLDHIAGLALDGDRSNDVHVANLSLGDIGGLGTCTDGGLRQAVCETVAAGITVVAAAGNSTMDASSFIPAAFPEVINVSATVERDGEPGGLGGCALWIFYCDDTQAEFSNYGATVDVAAPGYGVYSTWTGNSYGYADGTSMAAPHVAGAAALVVAARPGLRPSDVRELLMSTGECADGSWAASGASGNCTGRGVRRNDPDGYSEPLVNAWRAIQATPGFDALPTVTLVSPANGGTVSGAVPIVVTAADDTGVVQVEFVANGQTLSVDSDGADGYGTQWDTSGLAGSNSVTAIATDTSGQTAVAHSTVQIGLNPQGDWVGTYGADGYILAGWDGAAGDLASLPAGVSYTVLQGTPLLWGPPSTEARVLEDPTQAVRQPAIWYDATQLRVRLDFTAAYAGTVHLYAVDWSTTDRRQTVTVDDGRGPRSITLAASFANGAWMHYPIDVPAGGSVLITADRIAGHNAILSGVFLGGTGATAPGAPQDLSAIAGDASVSLAWSAPADDGGSPVTGYRVYRGTSPGTGTLLADTTAAFHVDPTAENGITYYYTVTALNGIGEGPASAEVSSTPVASATVPGAPQGLTATPGNASVSLAWSAPADDGESPVTGYRVYRGTSPGSGALLAELAATSLVDPTASNGTTYYYTVTGLNAIGEGPASNEASAMPVAPATAPGAPQGLTATPGNASVALAWSAPATDGGSPVTGYRIYRGTSPNPTALLATVANVLAYTDATAANGTTYHYAVAAVNLVGEGPKSTSTSATPTAPASAPGAPQNLTARTAKARGVDLAWTAPASNGGSTITGYRIYRGTTTGNLTFLVAVGTVTSYRDTATTKKVRYYYVVRAVNVVGEGAASNQANAVAK